MSALQIHITPAGIAAIVNAQNTGTSQVLIAQIGITDQVFSAEGAAALPGEIKRLVTFGGAAVAADTIHLTIRDDSADAYTLRGFGLYLGDGTLFAVYSHAGETPDYIMQKASAALLMLQADIRFTQLDATAITFGNADWLNPPATTTVQGVVELADNAEAINGADGTRAMTPAADKAALDARLGANAPSAFMKPLLALATAAAIRTALELKGAALKDEGAGKGLDADLLDGQHGAYYLAWANLTGKPATFAPSAHTHAWADITNPPATATRWPGWAEVTGKPITFAPAAHTHAAADTTSGTFAVARIPALPISQITNLQTALDAAYSQYADLGAGVDLDTITAFGGYYQRQNVDATSALNYPAAQAGALFVISSSGTMAQQVYRVYNTGETYTRALYSGSWSAWRKAWDTANFDPATKANAAHSHAWADLTNPPSTATRWPAWAEVTSKPATFPPDAHTHATLTRGSYLTGSNYNGGAATTWAVDATTTATASKVVARDASGDVHARLFRSEYDTTNGNIGFIMTQVNTSTDNFVRPSTPAQVMAACAASGGANFAGAVTAPTITGTTSDARLKTDIEDLRNCLELVQRLRPRRWRWIENGEEDFGYIAQEHREVIPGAVHEGEDGTLFVRYGKAEALIVGALHEISEVLDGLATRVQALEVR